MRAGCVTLVTVVVVAVCAGVVTCVLVVVVLRVGGVVLLAAAAAERQARRRCASSLATCTSCAATAGCVPVEIADPTKGHWRMPTTLADTPKLPVQMHKEQPHSPAALCPYVLLLLPTSTVLLTVLLTVLRTGRVLTHSPSLIPPHSLTHQEVRVSLQQFVQAEGSDAQDLVKIYLSILALNHLSTTVDGLQANRQARRQAVENPTLCCSTRQESPAHMRSVLQGRGCALHSMRHAAPWTSRCPCRRLSCCWWRSVTACSRPVPCAASP